MRPARLCTLTLQGRQQALYADEGILTSLESNGGYSAASLSIGNGVSRLSDRYKFGNDLFRPPNQATGVRVDLAFSLFAVSRDVLSAPKGAVAYERRVGEKDQNL